MFCFFAPHPLLDPTKEDRSTKPIFNALFDAPNKIIGVGWGLLLFLFFFLLFFFFFFFFFFFLSSSSSYYFSSSLLFLFFLFFIFLVFFFLFLLLLFSSAFSLPPFSGGPLPHRGLIKNEVPYPTRTPQYTTPSPSPEKCLVARGGVYHGNPLKVGQGQVKPQMFLHYGSVVTSCTSPNLLWS